MKPIGRVLDEYLNPKCHCGAPAMPHWRVCRHCWQQGTTTTRERQPDVSRSAPEQLQLGFDDRRAS